MAQRGDPIGSIINKEDIIRVRRVLADKPRDRLLFELGISSGLVISDLLQLRVGDLLNVSPGDHFIFSDQHKRIEDVCVLNEESYQAFQTYLNMMKHEPESFLFKSRKGTAPLNLSSVSNMVKGWFREAGLDGSYSARSLRKTCQYLQSLESQESGTNFRVIGELDPIEYQEVQEIVYQKLYEKIISGAFPPGTRLTATELSKQFKVSQTPVRMALSWLENKGLVNMLKKKGCVVRKITHDDLYEIIILRNSLEVLGFSLAWPSYNQDTMDLLNSLLKKYEHANDLKTSLQVHKYFHLTMYQDSNLPFLLDLINNLHDRTNAYFIRVYSNIQDKDLHLQKSFKKHQAILSSIEKKQPDKVLFLLEEDIQEGHKRIGSILPDD